MPAGIVLELQEEETIINCGGYISRERIVYVLNSHCDWTEFVNFSVTLSKLREKKLSFTLYGIPVNGKLVFGTISK